MSTPVGSLSSWLLVAQPPSPQHTAKTHTSAPIFRGTHSRADSFSKLGIAFPSKSLLHLASAEGETLPRKHKNEHPSPQGAELEGICMASAASHRQDRCPCRPATSIAFGALLVASEQRMNTHSCWSQYRYGDWEAMAKEAELSYDLREGFWASAFPSLQGHL